MRTYFISLLLLLLMVSGFSQTNTIRLHLEDPLSTEVKIGYHLGGKQYLLGQEGTPESAPTDETGNQLAVLDSQGNGNFTREGMEPGLYLIIFPPDNNYIEFVFEGKDLNVYAKGKYLIEHPGNSVSNNIKARNDELQKRRFDLQQEKPADLEQKMEALTEEYFAFLKEKRAAHPNDVFLKLLKAAENPDVPADLDETERFYYYREHYFDKIDVNADWLVRTPIFQNKVDVYFDKLTSKVPDSIIVAIDRIASLTQSNEELYKHYIVDQLNKYAKSKFMGHDKIYHHIAMNYYAKGKAPWTDEEQLEKIIDNAKAMEGSFVGDVALDFVAKSTTGESVLLHSIDSKYTMLFLMDPYCGHCKDMSDKIIELKDKIPTNLRIHGTVFNATMDEMKRIKGERNYFWPCVVPSESMQNVLRKAYNIKTYPMVYLLDANKKIIAKRISFEQVLEIIERMEE